MNGEQLCLSLVESGEGEKCIEWDRPSNTLGSAFLYFLWHVLCICGGWQSFDRGQTFFSDRPCHHTINLAHGPTSTTFGSRAINLKKCYFEATLCCQSPYFGQNLNLWASMSVALPWLSFVFVCSILDRPTHILAPAILLTASGWPTNNFLQTRFSVLRRASVQKWSQLANIT